MKKRVTNSFVIALSLMLALIPSASLAATAKDSRKAIPYPIIPTPVVNSTGRKPRSAIRQAVPTKNSGQSTTLLPDGRTLLIGGEGEAGPQTTIAISDAHTGEATVLSGKLNQARAWHTATVLPDGLVLILGGIGADGQVVRSAEVFDPRAKACRLIETSGLTPRAYHTATLLTDGSVLIAGGVSANGRTLAKAELWDSYDKRVTAVPSKLSASRQKHKATLLADGNVLIEGGNDGYGNQVTGAELYNSEAKSFSFTGLTSEQAEENTPYLAASLPANGASDVPLDSRIALRFSKPLRVESINFEAFKLTDHETTIAAKIVPAEAGRLAFVTPLQPLKEGTTYNVELSNASDGTNLMTPASISFTTVAGRKKEDQPQTIQALTDADWTPNGENFRGDWRSKFEKSDWQTQSPLQAAPGETALSGQVLTLRGQPLAGVTLAINGNTTSTDNTGRFLLTSLSAGHQVMVIDGRSASRPGLVYGIFRVGLDVTADKTNVLPYTIWMPKLDMAHAVSISSPTTKEVVITNPHIPGLELHLPAGTFIRDLDGQAVTQVSITPIPTDQSPFPLPSGVHVPTFFTIQPGGAQVIPPRAYVIYPNFTNDPPGSRINFWNYDPTEKGWYIYGQGTVSSNGKQVIPDPGVVLYEFSGLMDQTPDPHPADKYPKPGNDPGWLCRWFGICFGGPNGPGQPTVSGPTADPVDPGTGLFVYGQTDLFLPDTLPISLTRTYRPNDSGSRAFGIGTTHPYAIFLWGGALSQYQETNLILPDGGRVHYVRISTGTGWADAVYEHTETPTVFYKSRIVWNGNGWNLSLKDGTVFVFGENAPLQSIRDRYGNQITVSWSNGTWGNITQVTSPNGRWIQFTCDSSSRITQAKDNSGRTVSYIYDASGRLWKVTDANGGVTEYTYDSSHRMLTIKDPRQIVYLTNEYDIGGRITKQTLADTNTYQLAYTLDGAGNITQTDVTDQRANVRRITFSATGFPLTDTYALGKPEQQTITYERQPGTNLVTSITDALNRHTTYARDSAGYITDITALAGTPDAVTTHFTFEPVFKFLASVTDPLNHTVSCSYNANGNLTNITDPLSHQVSFLYNSAGQVVSATDQLNHITQFTYDQGSLSGVLDPLNRSTNLFVDSAGRVTSITNALGQTVKLEYDSLNRTTKVTDPLQGAISTSYDPNGNVLSVTDTRNGVVSYIPNNMDRVTTRRDPLLHDTTYQYNPDGTVHQVTDRKSQVTNYSYDALNRLIGVNYADTSSTTFTYDAGNRLTQTVDSLSGTITFAYDDLDRLTSKTTPQGTVSYIYDAAGRRTSMTVAGQASVNYTYDNANRLTQITQGTATVTIGYDDAGRRSSLTLPNGVITEYAYDEASQLTGLTYKKGITVLGNLTYGYDAAGRRIRMGGSYARSNLPEAVASTTYNAANQQTAFGGQSLTYDLNGNLTSDGSNTYAWNARDQLVSITGPALNASFAYDSIGNRISKTINGTITAYLYDGANLVQELAGGAPTANILTGGLDEVFTRSDATGASSPLTDALGSALALTDSSGSVQTQYTYEPFGKALSSGSPSNNASQYTGRENDGTGLYFYRGRYYSPQLQRFISEDPIGLLGGANLYAYVGNNPISYIDPFGLKPNNPGDDSESERQRKDVDRMLRGIVDSGKKNMEDVLILASLEGLGPAFEGLSLIEPAGGKLSQMIARSRSGNRDGFLGYINSFVDQAIADGTYVNGVNYVRPNSSILRVGDNYLTIGSDGRMLSYVQSASPGRGVTRAYLAAGGR